MSADSAPSPGESAGPTSSNEELAPRFEHLRALRSAWGVLASAAMSSHGEEIAETGRALTEHLTSIVDSRSDLTPAALKGIDNLLAEFEQSIRHVVESLPISQLRSTLPGYRQTDRQGLLDLLDVLLGTPEERNETVSERIYSLDYLITLLCTRPDAEPGVISFDPVTLTERLRLVAESVEFPEDFQLAEIEAEFFAAASLDTDGLREELQLRTLRNRKGELGAAFFAPRILRAIVTYNAALIARVRNEIVDSTDWGQAGETLNEIGSPGLTRCSAFESEPLRAVAEAVRRRAEGEDPEPTATDRMAWALDFDYLEENERKALCSDGLATADDPLGTAILIGLLSRSVAVLSIELQDAGLSPDEISEDWVDEVGLVFQAEINRHISEDAYKVACALSELKSKFLLAPQAEQLRERNAAIRMPEVTPPPAPVETRRPKSETARELVMDALEEDRTKRSERTARLTLQQIPWNRLGQGVFGIAILVAFGFFLLGQRNPDLDQISSDQLAAVSPYLIGGERNGKGQGLSFVGELDERWLELPHQERTALAEEIVRQLRSKGLQQIMIYDDQRRIRIQAIGTQPTRTL